VMKSACFVGARWSWHRDFPCLVSKTGVYRTSGPKQRGLTPLISPRTRAQMKRTKLLLVLASRPRSFGLEGRSCIARGEPHFAAEPRDHEPTIVSGEPTTWHHTGVLRARNKPIIASPAERKWGGMLQCARVGGIGASSLGMPC
jgi:hypothetical protein